MKFLTFQKNKRQQGMALILAIGFLAILSILGAVVMRVSTQDMKASGLVVPSQKAFYVADRAVEYALNRDMIYYLNPMGTPPTPTADLVNGTVPPYLASIHGSDFGANLYHVKVKTMANKGNTNLEAAAHVDAAIIRLYKKDDDQIFRTSGEG